MNTTDKVQVGDSTTSTSTSTTWHCPYQAPKTEQGWECPRCGRINAPWVRQCDCSRNNLTITSDWTYRPEWWRDYVYCKQGDSITSNPNTYQVGGSDYWNPNTKTYENTTTTAWNNLNTNTIHNGKINYKE